MIFFLSLSIEVDIVAVNVWSTDNRWSMARLDYRILVLEYRTDTDVGRTGCHSEREFLFWTVISLHVRTVDSNS